MTKRPNGHSFLFLGYDGRWHGWVTMTLGTTESRVRRHVSGKTREVVLAKVCDLERERDAHLAPQPGDELRTVADWLRYWILHVASRIAKPHTVSGYRGLVERQYIPRFGRIPLRDLREHHLDRMFASMLMDGATIASLREARRVLSTALNEAVARELVDRNVAHRARLPRARPVEIEPLTVDEARAVCAAAVTRRNGVSWLLHVALGLRRGEVLALQWRDIDLKTGTLTVRRTLEKRTYSHGCGDPQMCAFARHTPTCPSNCIGHAQWCPSRLGGLTFSPPKSIASQRTIVMPESLANALRHHRAASVDKTSSADGLVFHDGSGRAIDPDHHGRAWLELLNDAGVRRVRLHDARHTAATFLLMLGIDAKTTRAVMGWSHAEVSERYQHVVTPLRRDAAARIEALLWPTHVASDVGMRT